MTGGPVPLRDAFASPRTKSTYVRALFSTIADRYDLITVLLSFGMDRRWKRRVVRLAQPSSGKRALDLACGTGDIAFELAAHGAAVVGLDVTHRMLELGRAKAHPPRRATFVQGDMISLPFADASFDIVTTGYGLRNVPDLDAAFSEIHRVLRPGGTFVSLDFNRPESPLIRAYTWDISGQSAEHWGGCCTGIRIPIATFLLRSGGIRAPPASCGSCRGTACGT